MAEDEADRLSHQIYVGHKYSMADIPIIPGVSVATKGILNKPIKDIICALLFGGLNNMLKGPLLCVNADLDKLVQDNFPGTPSLKDLQADLKDLQTELKAFEAEMGVKEMLGRVNAAVAEVQTLLALDGLCAIPMRAPLIPDVVGQVIDAEYAEASAILNDLGRLSKPQLCLNGDGGINTGSYNPDSILGSIQHHISRMEDIPAQRLAALKKQIANVTLALKKSANRQLFPDFRHKQNLLTGRPYAGGAEPVVTLAAAPPLANQWNPPYPPADTPNLKDAAATAQTLVASVKKTASYPADVNGIRSENIWAGLLGPELYSMSVAAMTPQDPLFVQQDPVYDYCGKLVGYSSTVITGDQSALGGDPTVGAELTPPQTNFNFIWIADRNCWAVSGITSEQVVFGRKDMYLTANPPITLLRGYNHILGIPSMDLLANTLSPEFYIYKVKTDLTPDITQPFNLGLSRLETYELLADANGLDGAEGELRRSSHPTGTSLYFAAAPKTYAGTTPPAYPTSLVWWHNPITCVTQRWSIDADGNGSWIVVTQTEIDAAWVGSSTTPGDNNINYLAYSNKDGTVFGLLKLV
jgi:hypothetical protein